MVSKWCNICSEIKTASPVLNYCTKCGNDLRDKADLPKFKTYEERLMLIKKLSSSNTQIKTDKLGQIKLF